MPGLRIASHNVHGMGPAAGGVDARGTRITALMDEWAAAGVHVVCVQETWLQRAGMSGTQAQQRLLSTAVSGEGKGWVAHWAHNSMVGSAHRAGVGILVRLDLLQSGQCRVVQDSVVGAEDGRLLQLRLEWVGGGQTLTIVCAYLPNQAAQQRRFISERLVPVLQGVAGPMVLAGDFNFVPDPQLDCRRAAGAAAAAGEAGGSNSSRAYDAPTSALMQQVCAQHALVDAFRHLHPHRRSFTHGTSTSLARLDRLYMSRSLLPYLEQCMAVVHSVSDHRLVWLHLRPARAADVGPGRRRLRAGFTKDDALCLRFQQWCEEQWDAAPQQDDAALLRWYLGFKHRLVRMAGQLNGEHRRKQQELTAAQQAAKEQLEQALQAVEVGANVRAEAIAAVAAAKGRYAAAMAEAQRTKEGQARAREISYKADRKCKP